MSNTSTIQQHQIESDPITRATVTRFKYKSPSDVDQELYTSVLRGIAGNVKVGPFKATSGIMLPYYLNATTNLLDKDIAPKITTLMVQYLKYALKALLPQHVLESLSQNENARILICGMEVAGGVIVSQLCSANDASLNSWADYVYIRKERKNSGTKQQLEGPQFITTRTSESPRTYAIWVDDALSTGSSMTDGSIMLLQEYNIEVVGALYLVDRSADRRKLTTEYQYLSHNMYNTMPILSIFDLEEVDDMFREMNPELYRNLKGE